ncbi:MAG: Peptidase M16 domain protein [Candidatus Kaiserbacteria bacterium GW2011_GWB1_52_6]|uniref:Peptidase M16 domain protein n=2 Tax=Candidatus Kaiseribacteriota TaxID=1752734 RepID=A0A0G1XAZ1_9BACT|nr:MAG: Peptidase M16 domain protein [Candidatus Kaiserbacteria bacterium GW2011_GWA2_52_12]KKW28020.1 MAG: Peptidase M16 domain protein [Candidatus Kaiserbacteria bacterium GW2011_GWB1_52_6]
MEYHIHSLKNGLRIIFVPMEASQTATVMVMTGTGSRYENIHENGLAHFLEHMFFKGTKKRMGAREISEELDAIGSIYNAFTTKDRTAYHAKVSARYLDTALDVISDIFLNSTLPQKEITKERGAIIQEIDMYEDMPMHTIDNVFDALIFGKDHPLGRTILGPKENIRSFSRTEFTHYLKRNYTPANTVVCVAGSFSPPKVLATIKKEFGRLKHAEQPALVPFTETQDAPRIAIKEKKTDQTQLMLGMPSYPYLHKDEYALAVLATILGGGMSSRLFMEVREKRGLAYSVHTSVEKYPDTGYFVVSAGVEHGKLEKTVGTILAEFRKIKRTKVSKVELEKAKSYMKGTMTLSLETSDRIAQHATTSLLELGRVRSLEENIKGIDTVTAADIARVARDILRTEKLNLAIIGPHTNKEKLLKLLRV